MPMERDRYPENWDEIALAVKEAAKWCCQECGKQCRRPEENWLVFAMGLINEGWSIDLDRPTIYTLTTAHLDQNPANNDPSNLKALCAPCHLRHDAPFRLSNHTAKMERHGQLTIPFSEDL